MNDLMTLVGMGTFAGAVGATLCITQYVKPMLPKINARIISLAIALLIMLLVTASTGGTWAAYGLAVFNAVLIASSAIGMYELTFAKADAARAAEASPEVADNPDEDIANKEDGGQQHE